VPGGRKTRLRDGVASTLLFDEIFELFTTILWLASFKRKWQKLSS
jgi:hypothetical protein